MLFMTLSDICIDYFPTATGDMKIKMIRIFWTLMVMMIIIIIIIIITHYV